MKRHYIERPFEIKTLNAAGKFSGYASVFGDLDSYRDIVMPGAFKDSLARYEQQNRKVPVLWQHRSGEPIGAYERIEEDNVGLYVEGQLELEVQRAREAYALMKAKVISGISIGYVTDKDEYDPKTDIRKLYAVDLYEASIVTFPALDSARVSNVKSLPDVMTLRDCEAWLRDAAGLSSKEATTIISRIKAAGDVRDARAELSAKLKEIHNSFTQ